MYLSDQRAHHSFSGDFTNLCHAFDRRILGLAYQSNNKIIEALKPGFPRPMVLPTPSLTPLPKFTEDAFAAAVPADLKISI